ncbi:hypothetical protein G9A89_002088 [Geosiphon pyriformis]|nr:hypothetical protein G9A89_002088 [Geosiphon pyriformis]
MSSSLLSLYELKSQELDYLVVKDELILKLKLVKTEVDLIIENWTRKCGVEANFSDEWFCQYQLLEYIFDDTFSNIMDPVGFDKLFGVVSNLSDGKTAGLSGISNKL